MVETKKSIIELVMNAFKPFLVIAARRFRSADIEIQKTAGQVKGFGQAAGKALKRQEEDFAGGAKGPGQGT